MYWQQQKIRMLQQCEGSVSIEQMYDIANRNYQWQHFKYVVPKSYHHKHDIKQTYASRPEHKKNYIDDVLKIKKYVPAPNMYEPKPLTRPLSGKIDKNPRKTITETIMERTKNQKTPGPATYFKRPQTAQVTRSISPPEFKQHYLNEIQYLSSASPGVGDYNINYFKTSHVAGPKFKRQYSTSKLSTNSVIKKQKKQKGDKEDQFSQILIAGTFAWLASQKKIGVKSNFGKSHRFLKGSKFQKKPGPNSYELNYKWTDSNNVLMKTSASVASIKSVYYK